jgi:hypothetical protein
VSDLDRLVQDLQRVSEQLTAAQGKHSLPRLHGPPSAEALTAALARLPMAAPPSYRAFLERHNGWQNFWKGFTIVGADGAHTFSALADIAIMVNEDVGNLARLAPHDLPAMTRREDGDRGFVFLPNHIVFATDHSGQLLVFDRRTARRDGEMEVVVWTPGGIAERHANFGALLAEAFEQAQTELAEIVPPSAAAASVPPIPNVRRPKKAPPPRATAKSAKRPAAKSAKRPAKRAAAPKKPTKKKAKSSTRAVTRRRR